MVNDQEKKPYREGDDEEVESKEETPAEVPQGQPEGEAPPEPPMMQQEKEDGSKEAVVPVTAFMVCLMPDGRVEAADDVPIKMHHKPDLREMRDISQSLVHDIQITLTSKASAFHFTRTMAKAAQSQQIANVKQQIAQGVTPFPGKKS